MHNDIVHIKLEKAQEHLQAATICILNLKDILIKEPPTPEIDEIIINLDAILADCNNSYKALEQILE